MVKLKRVCERYDHIRSLENLLKFYSRNPDNWDKEWSVNPYYLVDLKNMAQVIVFVDIPFVTNTNS